jgi:hypothetical protein
VFKKVVPNVALLQSDFCQQLDKIAMKKKDEWLI